MPTFKIQGQVYHLMGSLLPQSGEEHKFLQIYFIGNEVDQVNRRCAINQNLKPEIVMELQNMLHTNNHLI